jgi:hypothetical protein
MAVEISYNENGCWEGTKEWKSFCKRYEKEDPAWVVYSTRMDNIYVRFVNTSWRMTIKNHPNWDEGSRDKNITHRKPLVYKKDIPQPKKWVDLVSDSDSD